MADLMEFWGVEVKPNQTVKCEPGEETLLHLSMAALGESKKPTDNVVTYVTINDQKLVIGTLSSENCPQISHDLMFEKEFELSHSSKITSVYFTGYKTLDPTGEDPSKFEFPSDTDDSESEEEEEVDDALKVKSNADKVGRKAKLKALKANKDEKDAAADDDSDDDDYEEDDGGDASDDEEMVEAEDSDDEDDEDDNSDEDEETPKKAADAKKKPAEPVTKAAVSEKKKKSKLATPSDGKKGGGDGKKDSPKKSGKKQQSPKSSGSVSCKSCSKTFISEGALESHTKAKHAAK